MVGVGLAIAAREYFQAHAPSGSVVGFRTLFEALQANGSPPLGDLTEALDLSPR